MKTRITWFGSLIFAISLGLPMGFILGVPSIAKAICNVEPQMNLGPGNNTLYDYSDGDSDEENTWYGGGGQDYLRTLPCKDLVDGQGDPDDVGGGSDVDFTSGGNGNDHVYGGAQDDDVFGNDNQDFVQDDETGDADLVSGGNANDTLVDGQDGDGNDQVHGDAGTDTCQWDSGDSVNTCP